MTRRVRYALLLTPAAMLIGATCVTSTAQRGPAGPWVAEVVNTGNEPVNGVAVRAHITDAAGNDFGLITAFTCPTTIPAGGRATAELFFPTDLPQQVVPPLHADFERLPLTGQIGGVTAVGLSARLLERQPEGRFVMAEVRNDSASTFWNVNVCANLRTTSGELLEVGNTALFPTVLRPGQSQTVPIFFNSMPEGTFEFFPNGSNICCIGTLVLDPSQLRIDATKVAGMPGQRVLHVAGELTNTTGQDITNARLVAYVAGAPQTRVEAPVGCGGTVGFGAKAGAAFAIPLDATAANPSAVIVGIEAYPSTELFAIPVSNVALQRLGPAPDGLGVVAVGAKISNPTSSWIQVTAACATLRDGAGKVVGVAAMLPAGGGSASLAPGATMDVDGMTVELAPSAKADVAAYGAPGMPPIATPGF